MDFEYVKYKPGSTVASQELNQANVRLASDVEAEEHQAEARRQAAVQDKVDKPRAVAAVEERLAVLKARNFPGTTPVERVRLLNKIRTAWHIRHRNKMIAAKYELIPTASFTDIPRSTVRKGNLLVRESTRGYPLGEADGMLLISGEVAAVATYSDRRRLNKYFLAPEERQIAGYSVIDPSDDFTARGVIGIWDKSARDLDHFQSSSLDYAAEELDRVIGGLGLAAASATTQL
jgi:hypothetical protein